MILGLDLGTSATKIVGIKAGKLCLQHYVPNSAGSSAADCLRSLLGDCLTDGSIQQIAVTGMRAERCDLDRLGLPWHIVPELQAIGRGAVWLTGQRHAVVASFGTGTAFIEVKDGHCTHLGGTGVGGGTLVGLGRKILHCEDVARLDALARQGDTSKVDLSIGDMYSGERTLPAEMTASNLARPQPSGADADWAAGIFNLVLQVVGSMALFCANGCGTDTVVVVGGAAGLSVAQEAYEKFCKVYQKRFLLPEQGRYATAIGAVISVDESYKK